jgi:hypothetical protein
VGGESPLYETRRIKKSFPVVNPQEISIIIIIELLRNSKDYVMYRLAWLPSWVVSVWSVSPETDSTKEGADGTISILPQNGEPSGKKIRHFKHSQKIMYYLCCTNIIYKETSSHTENVILYVHEDENMFVYIVSVWLP